MVVVIHGTNGIVAPGLTSEDSAGIVGQLTASSIAYPTSDGAAKKVITTDGSGNLTFDTFGSLTPSVVTADTTGVAGYAYYLDSDGITLTLPASPSVGDIVGVSETAGGETSVIGRNSSKIMGLDSDMTIDTAYAKATLIYTGASKGWALT